MKYSLLALFAPLFLIGLTTVCMAGHDTVADKLPNSPKEQYLYITNKIDFSMQTNIYLEDGTSVYMAVPSTEKNQPYVTIKPSQAGGKSQKFKLPFGIDCQTAWKGSYFLSHPKGKNSYPEWILQTQHETPQGSELYYPEHGSEPAGVIRASVTNAATVAEISDVVKTSGNLRGNYYCMHLVPHTKNLPLFTPAEVIMFVYQVLEAKNRCSKRSNKNRLG